MSQAIDAAGGLTAEADVTGLNRASKITDGQKIYVPTVGEQQAAAAVGGAESSAATTPGAGSSSGLVNINTASAAELQTLSALGLLWLSRLSMSGQRTVLLPQSMT